MFVKRSTRQVALWLAVVLLVSWFGMSTAFAASTETRHTVRRGESWWSIGRKYGVPYRVLAEHNGKKPTDTIYVGQTLSIPGTGSSSDDRPVSSRTHKVVRGDTWWRLGKTYGLPYQEIAEYNGKKPSDTIYVGQTLKIPSPGESVKPAPTPTPAPTPAPAAVTYRVKRGDSWWGIARAYGVSYQELARYNGKKPTDTIYVGQTLKIPGGGKPEDARPTPTPAPSTELKPLTEYSNARSGWSWLYGKSDERTLRAHDAYYRSPDRRSKVIYLTFDCGYEYKKNTAKILDVLKAHDVQGSFFLTGRFLQTDPGTVRRMINEGHDVGNHGDRHVAIHQPIKKVQNDIRTLETAFRRAMGRDLDPIYRPPSGEWSRRGLELARREGYRSFMWTYAYRDWDVNNQMQPAHALRLLKEHTSPGMILLLHAISETNTKVLGDYLEWAKAQGYTFKVLGDFPK